MQSALGEYNLEELRLDAAPFDRKSDQSTPWHKKFYASATGFLVLYREFIEHFAKPTMGFRRMVYQAVPTFRIDLPGNVAVGEFHRDTDYGHSPHEMNFWVPVTKAFGTNTVWIEGDCMELEYGQVLIFNGSQLHGNHRNETGVARVSFDFRVLSYDDYRPTNRRSVSAGKRFVIGDYFEVL